ncbi:MAG TPA: hypothetical protein VMY34_06075 [Acidimicrobiales bacterium]|nr:hypothetical protein [Acidimicrobiales bacterium]
MTAEIWEGRGHADPAHVLRAFNAVRRRRRLAAIRWMDLITDAYGTALAGSIVLSILIDAFGGLGAPSAGSAPPPVTPRIAALAGALACVVVILGAREGRLGGPLALEAAHVRHVLWSPIDRSRAMRGPLLSVMARRLLIGALGGAALGLVIARSSAGPTALFVAGTAFCGAITSGVGLGVAVLTNRMARPARLPLAITIAFLGWSLNDAWRETRSSPVTWLANLAVGPDRTLFVVGPAIALLLATSVLALARVGGTSIELAERRAALVSMVRFSVTTQDLRSVIVLRRLLTLEIPRRRPWFRIDPWAPTALPAWRRGWHGLLRWPAGRIVRCLVLGAVSGAAAVGAWKGTNLLLVVAGVAMYLVALDVVEPLAQEDDHPQLRDLQPIEATKLAVHLLSAPVSALFGVALVALGTSVAFAIRSDHVAATAALGVLLVAPSAVGAAAGALWSLMRKPPDLANPQYLMAPEAFGTALVVHYCVPIILASAGFAPVLIARSESLRGQSALDAAWAAAPAAIAITAALAWVLNVITTAATKKGKRWIV